MPNLVGLKSHKGKDMWNMCVKITIHKQYSMYCKKAKSLARKRCWIGCVSGLKNILGIIL